MKILHIADLHLGKTVGGFSQLEGQRHILQQVLDLVDGREVDVLAIAGDVYDKSQPSAEAVALLDWFLTQLARRPVQVVGIPGNHDSAERIAYGASMLESSGIHLAPLFDGNIEPVLLHDEHGPVAFWPVPFLRPAQVRPFFPDAPIGTDYEAALRAVIERAAPSTDIRNVAVAHQFVTARHAVERKRDAGRGDGGAEEEAADGAAGAEDAAETELPMRSDSEAFVGTLENVDASVFAPFDYTALGHLHRPQRIGSERIRYAGSPLKYSASEAFGAKSAPLVTLGPKDGTGLCPIDIELVPLEPLHDMRVIAGPLERLVDPAVVQAADPRDYIHAVITDETLAMNARLTLRAAYPNLMTLTHRPGGDGQGGGLAESFGVDAGAEASAAAFPSIGPNAGVAGLTDPADALQTEEAADPLELFRKLYRTQNGTELDGREEAVVQAALDRAFGSREGA